MTKRALTVKDVLTKKHKTYAFDGLYKEIFGQPSTSGYWLIYGKDKNGKTWAALLIAKLLSMFAKVWYISAEEGVEMDFQNGLKRAGIVENSKSLHFNEYISIEGIKERLKSRNAPQVVLIDNLSMYKGEITSGDVTKLKLEFPHTHFVMVAHEERNEPYTAAAVMCKKLAKVIIHIQGLTMFIGGRVPGGTLMINEEKAMLYHGNAIKE